MHVVVRRRSLVLVNHNLSITALLREAECGPAAASAISLLTYKRKRWWGEGLGQWNEWKITSNSVWKWFLLVILCNFKYWLTRQLTMLNMLCLGCTELQGNQLWVLENQLFEQTLSAWTPKWSLSPKEHEEKLISSFTAVLTFFIIRFIAEL